MRILNTDIQGHDVLTCLLTYLAFGRAILCLSKIGEELYFEATSDGVIICNTYGINTFPSLQLSLRTVNSGRSAYTCFTFCPTFFHHYDDGRSQLNNATCTSSSQTNTVKCKVPIKVRNCISKRSYW